MPCGGDHSHPLQRLQGLDLRYAAVLMQAICEDTTEAGQRFNHERHELFRRWKRLVRAMDHYRLQGMGSVPSELQYIEKYFDQLELDHIVHARYYPEPRPLTAEEEAEYRRRSAIGGQVLLELYQRIGSSYAAGDEAAVAEWNEACSHAIQWENEVGREAYAHVRKRVPRRRRFVTMYRAEITAFCQRWHLNAWWAVPMMIQAHLNSLWIEDFEPLGMYTETFEVSTYSLVIRLPGRSDEDFERDKQRLKDYMLDRVATSDTRQIQVLLRPSREQMAVIERELDAACVVVDWDGQERSSDPDTPGSGINIREFVVQQCRGRLEPARHLTYRQERVIRSQLDCELRQAREFFKSAGWSLRGDADIRLHASWVAQRLLDPSNPWSKICGNHGIPYLLPSALEAIARFCPRAGLTLPK